MKALMLKDILNLRKYLRTLGIISLIYVAMSVAMGNPSVIIGMAVFISLMLVTASFSYDENAKWNAYCLSLPITRAEFVSEKYLFGLASVGAIGVFSILLSICVCVVTNNFVFAEIFASALAVAFISLFYFSISLPVMFKYGIEKSRVVMIGFFALFALAFALISAAGSGMSVNIQPEAVILGVTAIPIIIIGCFIASYFLSVRIVSKKDF